MFKCNFNEVANFIKITFRHECSLVNLLHILRAVFPKNNYRRLLLNDGLDTIQLVSSDFSHLYIPQQVLFGYKTSY